MTAYIIRRLIQAVFVLIIASLLVFFVMHLLPGDPLSLYTTEILSPEQAELLRKEFGLDKPLMIQYIDWMSRLFRGDLGTSFIYRVPVATLLAERLLVTIHLGSLTLVLSSILGIWAGLVAALRRGKWADTVTTLLANLGVCVPSFWLGIMLIYVFAFYFRLLPLYGYTSPLSDFWLSTKRLIMPVICLSLFSVAGIARQTRSSMLEVLRQDYIRTAWAKGLTERLITTRHALKNGLIPVITMIGLQVPRVIGGAVLIETIFSIPGLGRLIMMSTLGKDFQVVQGSLLLCAVIVVLSNLVVDLCYGWLDPRVRYA